MGGVYLSATLLQFLTAAILIWSISLLQIRGRRLSGLTSTWIGLVMITPLIIMSIVGIISWIKSGTTVALPFTPPDTTMLQRSALDFCCHVELYGLGVTLPLQGMR